MADNFTANATEGAKTFRSEDISGIQFPTNKIALGDTGTNDGPVSSNNPLPISRTKPANLWSYAAASGGIVNTTGITAKAAPGVGLRIYVGAIDIVNSHPTQGTEIVLRDGASGTVLWRTWAAPNGGGISKIFDPGIRCSANTLLEIAEISATATNGVYVNLSGWIGS